MLTKQEGKPDTIQQNYRGSRLTKVSVKPLKLKVCKICRTKFQPTKPLQSVCSTKCALEVAIKTRDKILKTGMLKQKREDKAKREKLKSRSDWIKEAQSAFNAFIRERDKDEPCISCGRHHNGQYHAGHFYSVGARPELRFNEDNVHKQCSACNNYLSGNVMLYRKALIEKIGLERVESLSGYHPAMKYTIIELKFIKQAYAARLKEIKHD
jgi:predicted amidophosphoribosyltransferase